MTYKGRPAGLGSGGGRRFGGSLSGATWLHSHFTPVALAVSKRGRRCIVAKATHFEGEHEPILAVAWRGQQGTKAAISLPVAALQYAKQAGASHFYLRDDRAMTMLTCDLAAFERGQLRADGERYIPLAWLQPVPWRQWAYAERVLDLATPAPVVAAQQLGLGL